SLKSPTMRLLYTALAILLNLSVFGQTSFPSGSKILCLGDSRVEGSETYDHWELRVHKRLLEMDINSGKDESALRQVTRIEIPDTVSIELSMRVAN
ncbi:MAG: 30S ribosomal protein S10, partial [Candidatus Thermoplasmatota archaeon]|nr:30S ribosomal protein S10 [Candidatus Thermoplasmatota archaeon]